MSKQNSKPNSGNSVKTNNQRANVKNPNNPVHKQAGDNRANQSNPNHAPTKGNKK